ncbi:hypothetical protein MMC30_007379 [Trapelia coarctata]|nr:hypothetical protein [Trapelia coarctata]
MDGPWSPQMPQYPFGYAFQDAPAPPAPGPAQGEALLNDREANVLTDFFIDLDRGFVGDGIPPWALVPEEDEQLPPLYAEPTTSAGYAPLVPYETAGNTGIADQVYNNPFNSGRLSETTRPATTSPTVMAAANTLMRNGNYGYHPVHANDMLSNGRFDHVFGSNAHINPVRKESVPLDQRYFASNTTNFFDNGSVGPYVHGSITSMNNASQNISRAYSISNELPAMMPSNGLYNPPTFDRKDFVPRGEGSLLHFGSDENFANNGFMPPPNLETEDHVTDKMLQSLDSFEAQTSATNTAANTQPSSPIMPKSKRKPSAPNGRTKLPVPVEAAPDEQDVGITQKPKSTKRRKSRADVKAEDVAIEDEEDEWEEPKQRRGKRQKSTSANNSASGTNNASGPRAEQATTQARGSQSADRKSGRENLTDEQRRNNHIHSEQKRRNAIKDGYDELIGFVPGLKAGGFSRSASMTQAVDWLKELMSNNVRLRIQLDRLKEGVGARVS